MLEADKMKQGVKEEDREKVFLFSPTAGAVLTHSGIGGQLACPVSSAS